MIIACPACSTRYAVPDSAIGVEGRTVRCAKCKHSWFQDGTSPEQLVASQAAAPVTPRPSPAAPGTERVAPEAPPAPSATEACEPSPPVATASEPARPSEPPAAPPAQPALAETTPRSPQAAPAPARTAPPAAPKPAPESKPTPATESNPVAPGALRKAPAAVYDDTQNTVHYADERNSSFDFAPPFRPRRNWARIGTYAASVFAVITFGLTGAIAFGGLPDWIPVPHETFRKGEPDLQLDFPRKRQDRQRLADGSEFFSVSGTIGNIGSETRYVPSLLVVLRDARERIIYEKEIVPPARKLAAGEVITINEALTDIPKAATTAEIGWKPD